MTRSIRDARDLLSPLNPVQANEIIASDEERRADARRILSAPREHDARPSRQSAPRRLVLAGAGAVAVVVAAAVGVSVVGGSSSPAFAATPPLLQYAAPDGTTSAADALRRIAERAEPQSGPVSDRYEYLSIQSWDLWTRVSGKQASSQIVVNERKSWRGSDGSGAVITNYEPYGSADAENGPPNDAQRQDFGAGQFPAMWRDTPPLDAASLKAWLKVGHPASNGPAETIVAVTDLARERVLSPNIEANLLRIVADLPGLSYDGAVTDRAGRHGEAFSITSAYSGLPTRYTLIVAPETGKLLGYEKMLTSSAGKLNVKVPAVIGYETYLDAGYQPKIG
jgi:hypothetical protein